MQRFVTLVTVLARATGPSSTATWRRWLHGLRRRTKNLYFADLCRVMRVQESFEPTEVARAARGPTAQPARIW